MIPSGTTPTLTFSIPDNIINKIDNETILYITFQQGGITKLEKELKDVTIDKENSSITFDLTQAETLIFNYKLKIDIQIRIKFSDGKAIKSGIVQTTTDKLLKAGEI